MVGLTTNAANVGGFDSLGRICPAHRHPHPAGDRRPQAGQGGGIRLPRRPSCPHHLEHQPDRKRGPQGNPGRRRAACCSGDEILSVGDRLPCPRLGYPGACPSIAFSPGRARSPIRVRRDDQVEIGKTVVLSKLPDVWRDHRHQPGRGPGEGSASTSSAPTPPRSGATTSYGALAKGGVILSEVLPGSGADDAGLKIGQVIIEVEGERVRNPVRLRPGPSRPAEDSGRPQNRGRPARHREIIRRPGLPPPPTTMISVPDQDATGSGSMASFLPPTLRRASFGPRSSRRVPHAGWQGSAVLRKASGVTSAIPGGSTSAKPAGRRPASRPRGFGVPQTPATRDPVPSFGNPIGPEGGVCFVSPGMGRPGGFGYPGSHRGRRASQAPPSPSISPFGLPDGPT